jgi:hypothetical protein
MAKRGAKAVETPSDNETDEEPSSSDPSDIDEDEEEATQSFATIIRGPPTVTDGEDAAGKH